jgi:uncharacterized protein YbcC (UPF0753/DUF2309 family)
MSGILKSNVVLVRKEIAIAREKARIKQMNNEKINKEEILNIIKHKNANKSCRKLFNDFSRWLDKHIFNKYEHCINFKLDDDLFSKILVNSYKNNKSMSKYIRDILNTQILKEG